MIWVNLDSVYFIGVGGIGMSALARYFLSQGKEVAGYDRASTPLTEMLTREGIDIHFEDKSELIPIYRCIPESRANPGDLHSCGVRKSPAAELFSEKGIPGDQTSGGPG